MSDKKNNSWARPKFQEAPTHGAKLSSQNHLSVIDQGEALNFYQSDRNEPVPPDPRIISAVKHVPAAPPPRHAKLPKDIEAGRPIKKISAAAVVVAESSSVTPKIKNEINANLRDNSISGDIPVKPPLKTEAWTPIKKSCSTNVAQPGRVTPKTDNEINWILRDRSDAGRRDLPPPLNIEVGRPTKKSPTAAVPQASSVPPKNAGSEEKVILRDRPNVGPNDIPLPFASRHVGDGAIISTIRGKAVVIPPKKPVDVKPKLSNSCVGNSTAASHAEPGKAAIDLRHPPIFIKMRLLMDVHILKVDLSDPVCKLMMIRTVERDLLVKLEELEKTMFRTYRDSDKDSVIEDELNIYDYCGLMQPDQQACIRVQVLRVFEDKKDKVFVFLIDYGRESMVRRSNLVPLKPEFKALEQLSCLCELKGPIRKGREIPEDCPDFGESYVDTMLCIQPSDRAYSKIMINKEISQSYRLKCYQVQLFDEGGAKKYLAMCDDAK